MRESREGYIQIGKALCRTLVPFILIQYLGENWHRRHFPNLFFKYLIDFFFI